jgi:hypothetical protein
VVRVSAIVQIRDARCSAPLPAWYAHLRPILDTGQDKTGHVPDKPEADDGGYVRGSAYYAGGVR